MLLCRLLTFIALLASTAAAQVSLDAAKNELTLETDSTKLVLRGAAIATLVNKHNGTNYVVQQGVDWISLNLETPVEKPMTGGAWELVTNEATGEKQARIPFRDETRSILLHAGVDSSTGEIFVRPEGSSSNPGVQSIFWGAFGLDLVNGKMIIPGQAGTWYGNGTTPNIVGLDYPVHWESQFFVYEHTKGSVLIYANDATPHFKRLHASRENGTLDFGFEVFAVAPWDSATTVPAVEWRFKSFPGDWKEPTSYYREWWQRVRPPVNVPQDPEWSKDVNVVLTILYLDFPTLEFLAKAVNASKTMLYLTDWRKDPFDVNYPDYSWTENTKKYIERARELGFRIMLHANLLGVSETNPGYAAVGRYQLRTANDKQQIGWLWDLEPGHIRRLAYISPNIPEYRKLFIDSIRPAIQELKPDALHLDAGGAIVNDGNGLYQGRNTIQGLAEFHAEIRANFPELLLGYESLTEINAPYIRYAQRWSSITPPHPISTFLNGEKVLSFGFLDQPHADENEFTSYLKRYEGQGILPTAPVASMDDFDETRPRTYRLFELFRLWQDHQFRPDWETDWNGAVFRYRSRDGKTTAHVEHVDNFVRLVIGDEVFYERVQNAAAVESPHYVRDWPAFEEGRLVGLDPTEQYWIEPEMPRPNSLPHLAALPPELRVGKQTFVSPEFGLFSVERNNRPSFDFASQFWQARTGTMFTSPLRERPMVAGALARVNPVLVGGKLRNSVLLMHPPYQGIVGGVTFTEYEVEVPQAPRVEFQFEVAIADIPQRKEPATFVVWINGVEAWRNYVGTGAWVPGRVDLTRYAGSTIKLRVISGPGPRNIATYAFTCWSELRIVTATESPTYSFEVRSPEGVAAASETVQLQTGESDKTWRATVDVPGRFVLFVKPPTDAELGKSLFDYPYTASRSAFNSLPSPYKSDWNVVVRSIPTESAVTRLLFAQPPRNGRVYTNWTLRLPENVQSLDFDYGLMEPEEAYRHLNIQYSGAEFIILVNGEQVFQSEARLAGPRSGRIDLSRWAGKPVLIQVAVDAAGSAIFDWCFFSKMELRGAE